jgi:hypothetical protein
MLLGETRAHCTGNDHLSIDRRKVKSLKQPIAIKTFLQLVTPAKDLLSLQTFIGAVSAAITGQWKTILNQ